MTKALRTNLVIPTNIDLAEKYDVFDRWYQGLWVRWPYEVNDENVLLVLAYISIQIDSGQSRECAIDIVGQIEVNSKKSIDTISIPSQRFDYSDRWTNIALSSRSTKALNALSYRWHKLGKKFRKVVSIGKSTKLQEKIERSYKAVLSNSPESMPSFAEIGRAAKWIACRRGFDPYILSVYSGSIRPVDEPLDSLNSLSGVLQEHQISSPHRVDPQINELKTIVSQSTRTKTKVELDPKWIHEAKKLLRNMCKELNDNIYGRVNTPLKQERALAIIAECESKATNIAPEDSALLWGIKYAKYAYVEKHTIVAKSLRDYLDRCLINGLLRNPRSDRLSTWEPEDFLDNFESRISDVKLSPRSKQSIVKAYMQFFQFLSKNIDMPRIASSDLKAQMVFGAGQWRLIAPAAIDTLIAQLQRTADLKWQQVSTVIGLGYYGGLRSAEISNLTLSDIVYDQSLPFLDVETLRGKSENARRRIPMDALAPPDFQELLKSTTALRQKISKTKKLADIALFGPEDSANGYTPRSLSQLANECLKTAFGAGVNLHTLRHCFCSNLFLRWYGLRYPEVFEDLRSRGHPLFQPSLQNNLSNYFSCMPLEDGEIRPYDLISIIKLTGHASPEILFSVYIHCLYIVQRHTVERVDRLNEVGNLNDDVLSALVPKMKSSASRAKWRRESSD